MDCKQKEYFKISSYPSFFYFFLIFFALSLSSCKSSMFVFSKKHSIYRQIAKSEIFKTEFTGFSLFDIEKNKSIVRINAGKYFTPASNTKVFTFYTSISVLKDSMPILKYLIKADSLIFWGTGNPLCLNPDFENYNTAIDFLKRSNKKLFFCAGNFHDERFGSGWAWDDYIYDYQLEKTPFPINGNRLVVNYTDDSLEISPDIFNITTVPDSNYYNREEFKNVFTLGKFATGTKIQIPFITDSTTIINLLSDATAKDIRKCPVDGFNKKQIKTLKIKLPDTLYLRLLHNSDNFIAEQLMQMCSISLFDTLNTKKAIKYSKKHILTGLQDKCRWVDGSGLSRYNLFSPDDMVYVLRKIYSKLSWKQITKFFPTAGKSGTLKNSYSHIHKPFIYAKSGSLSNNYNLSGYIQTKKGNRYIFSFMNNHFLGKSKKIKQEMEKIFIYIYENL